MRRLIVPLAALLVFATTAAAQIGKSVSVSAGTQEDKDLAAIYATADGPDKIKLLDKFVADYNTGDLPLLADQLYAQTYLTQKNYAKVYEYGEKAMVLDPDDFSALILMVHAADEQGDAQKLFSLGERVGPLLAHYQASVPPAGMGDDQWAAQKTQNMKDAQADISYAQYTMVNAAYKTSDPTARTKLLERYAKAFPDSPYTLGVREQTAIAYQQAQNTPKMIETAQDILAKDPGSISMLLLLADNWSENGQQLDKAGADAKKALDLLGQAKKPDNVTDDQWQKQISIQKGLAYSVLGQVYVNNDQNAQAVDAFKQASPLLKPDPFSYARNLYRLGFTLAKMQKNAEARTVLTEAVSINSPYKAKAQQTLNKIGGAAPRKGARKAS
ncbi:MAG: tetratricopeptide repeat protein [Candidatus Acidiferrales bacterium]